MSASFEIQFTPDEKKEYVWDLVVETEREKFLVPIRAFGSFTFFFKFEALQKRGIPDPLCLEVLSNFREYRSKHHKL